jgi:hypothetical protein
MYFIDITADATGKSEREKMVRTFLLLPSARSCHTTDQSSQGNQIEWPEDLADLPRGRNELPVGSPTVATTTLSPLSPRRRDGGPWRPAAIPTFHIPNLLDFFLQSFCRSLVLPSGSSSCGAQRTWFPGSWFVQQFRKGFGFIRPSFCRFPDLSMRFGAPGTWFLRSYLFMNFGLDLHWYKPEIFGRILRSVFISVVVLSDGGMYLYKNVWCVADYMCL